MAIYINIIAIIYNLGGNMVNATISHLKNHLPEIVHDVEKGNDIQITRHGNPVAVIVSLERYNHAFSSKKGIYNAIQRWRSIYLDANGFSEQELEDMRSKEPHQLNTSCWSE